MDIKDRIQVIIDSHRLNAGEFALKIGVQRSSVSHVLSGRNKPGFDFLEKIILAFPRVDAVWLLTGKQVKSGTEASNQIAQPSSISNNALIEGKKKPIKIVLFYEDRSFEVFEP